MKCFVTIDSGKAGVVSSAGELCANAEGFELFYTIDGDECFLNCSGGVLTQKRRGKVDLKMIFAQGKHTQCYLGEGGLSGAFTVFTDRLRVRSDEKSAEVLLGYILGKEKFNLRISAK